MRTNQIVGRCILVGLFCYLAAQSIYIKSDILPSAAEGVSKSLVCLFLAQSVLFAISILAVLLLSFLQYRKKKHTSPFEALVLLSDGKIKSELLLQNQRSFMITGKKNGGGILIERAGEVGADRYLYGIGNLVSGCWYLEVSSGIRPVGLRRGSEGMIYRLKEGVSYPLSKADIIYADTGKIVVRQQKYLEG